MTIENLTEPGGETYLYDPKIKYLLDSPLIQQSEVIGTREGGIVDCWVPTELIDHEEVPVKTEWAESLAKEMREISEEKGGSGQLTPVVLGLIEGEEKLKIIDGFHRDAALKINHEEKIYSAVQLTDWDGLYDVRIFTAKDHAHVRFSRVVQWIREVWKFSGLDEKMTLEQAILLYRYETSGSRLGLKQEDVETAKEWVARKEQQWDMAAMTIHSYLKVAETVDPKLVHSTREKKKGRILEAPTQVILKIFADLIPNDFAMQNLVMDCAKAHNLTGPKVKSVCAKVAGKSYEEAAQIIRAIDWDEWEPHFGETKLRNLRRAYDSRHRGGKIFDRTEWELKNISRRIDLSSTRGEKVDVFSARKVNEAIERAKFLQSELAKIAIKLTQLGEGQVRTEAPRVIEQARPNPAANQEITKDQDGLREDILAYLSGETSLASVGAFNKNELVDCMRKIEKQKDQPKDWRKRFIAIQAKAL